MFLMKSFFLTFIIIVFQICLIPLPTSLLIELSFLAGLVEEGYFTNSIHFYVLLFFSFLVGIFLYISIKTLDSLNDDHSITSYSHKSLLKIWLICYFLGLFGVHRFYVGKYISGIIMLVTFGGLGIWWTIDLVLITLTKFKDSNNKTIKTKSFLLQLAEKQKAAAEAEAEKQRLEKQKLEELKEKAKKEKLILEKKNQITQYLQKKIEEDKTDKTDIKKEILSLNNDIKAEKEIISNLYKKYSFIKKIAPNRLS